MIIAATFVMVVLITLYLWCDLAGRWFNFTFKMDNFPAFMTGEFALAIISVTWLCSVAAWFGLI